MADIKQFGLKGVGGDVQFGKDGGVFSFETSQEFVASDSDRLFYLPIRAGEPTDPQHLVTRNFFETNQTPGFYGVVVRESDGTPAFGGIDTFTFNRDDGFYLTQGTDPSEVIVNFAGQAAATVDRLDVAEHNPSGDVFVDPNTLNFNQGDGFYLTTDSSGEPVVNLDADPRFRRAVIGTGATQNIGIPLPLGAIVNRVKLSVRVDYDNNPEIVIRSDGSQIYMPADQNDPKDKKQTIFVSETQPDQAAIDGTRQLQATVTNAPTVGSAAIQVEYLLPS